MKNLFFFLFLCSSLFSYKKEFYFLDKKLEIEILDESKTFSLENEIYEKDEKIDALINLNKQDFSNLICNMKFLENLKSNEAKFIFVYHFLLSLPKKNYDGLGNVNYILKNGLNDNSFYYYLAMASLHFNFGFILATKSNKIYFFIKILDFQEKICGFHYNINNEEYYLFGRNGFKSEISSYDLCNPYVFKGDGFSFKKFSEDLPSFYLDKKFKFKYEEHKLNINYSSFMAEYLKFLPESFEIHFLIGIEEIKKTNILQKVNEIILDKELNEYDTVNFLLRLVANIPYRAKPICSISENLYDNEYDCDNASLILSSILYNLGYNEKSILFIYFEDPSHMFIALKPKEKTTISQILKEENICKIRYEGNDYFLLDPRYASSGGIYWGICNGDEYLGKPNEYFTPYDFLKIN